MTPEEIIRELIKLAILLDHPRPDKKQIANLSDDIRAEVRHFCSPVQSKYEDNHSKALPTLHGEIRKNLEDGIKL